MKMRIIIGSLIWLFVLVGMLAFSPPLYADMDSPNNQFSQEYLLSNAPLNLSAAAAGHVWFTMPAANQIGVLVVSPTVTITTYTIPTTSSQPYDLLYSNGAIWFTEQTGNKIGRLNSNDGTFQEFVIPTSNSEPTGIAQAGDGTIWFAERAGNKIGHFDPNNVTFEEVIYPVPGAKFEDIAVSGSDLVWVTSPDLNRLVGYDPSRKQFFTIITGDQTRPNNVALDRDGTPWITASLVNRIGRYTPGTLGAWRWYDLPIANSGAAGIVFKDNNDTYDFWYTGNNGDVIGQLTAKTSGRPLALYGQTLTSPDSHPWGIAVDDQGTVWVAASGINKIIEWKPPYFSFIRLPMVLRN